MTEPVEVFLSYSRNDRDAAALLHTQLQRAGLLVFKDDKNIRWSERWLDKLQEAVEGCRSFMVLVGRDGVKRWIGAETEVALNRYFGPHDDKERLPIFPILLDGTEPDTLPVFLRLFQARPWNGSDLLPGDLLSQFHRPERSPRPSASRKNALFQKGLPPRLRTTPLGRGPWRSLFSPFL